MGALVKAEFLKLFTTRLIYFLALAMLALTALGAILTLVFTNEAAEGLGIAEEFGQRGVFGAGSNSRTFALVLGIIAMAGEYRQGTLTPTFLAHPVRWRVVVSKAAVFALAGLALGVLSSLLAVAIGYVGFGIIDIDLVLSTGEIAALLGGSILASGLFGVLGVGAGALIPNQVAALSVVLIEQLVAEPILFGLFPDQAQYFVAGAASVLSGAESGFGPGASISVWAATGILVAWCAAIVGAGTIVTERKDIT